MLTLTLTLTQTLTPTLSLTLTQVDEILMLQEGMQSLSWGGIRLV